MKRLSLVIFIFSNDGKIDEVEAARLIKTEISPLLPDRENEIALQLSELRRELFNKHANP
ncbi:hypothetical protein [Neobacillus drentensis]|uniref:hypothetical protein n=1 Tax=Neobacillus drentensis TaxID=220684 RepID=UPI002FFEE419